MYLGQIKPVTKKLLGRGSPTAKKQQLGRHQLDATLSNEAYDKVRKDHGDWMVEKYHNNSEHSVHINNRLKEIKVAFRGTANLKDVGTDVKLAFGKLSNTDRYKREDNLINQLKRMYPNYKITVTGHSLGSTLAHELANKHGLEGSGFNGGFGVRGKINNDNFTNYRTKTDLVSGLGVLRGEKFKTVDGFGHSASNFMT
jgi:hypothetical protein